MELLEKIEIRGELFKSLIFYRDIQIRNDFFISFFD